jgi:hypothetical protein
MKLSNKNKELVEEILNGRFSVVDEIFCTYKPKFAIHFEYRLPKRMRRMRPRATDNSIKKIEELKEQYNPAQKRIQNREIEQTFIHQVDEPENKVDDLDDDFLGELEKFEVKQNPIVKLSDGDFVKHAVDEFKARKGFSVKERGGGKYVITRKHKGMKIPDSLQELAELRGQKFVFRDDIVTLENK